MSLSNTQQKSVYPKNVKMKIAEQRKKVIVHKMIKENTYVNLKSVGNFNCFFYGEHLEMLDPSHFVNCNIVNFCEKYLIKKCPCPDNFLYLDFLLIK